MFSTISYQQPREVSSVVSLLPKHLIRETSAVVALLEEYYRHLNTDGMPSYELSKINTIADIDSESLKYIDQIAALIAPNIGKSDALDRVELFRAIVKYYNTRGSEDSIHLFFKIFYDAAVEVFIPRKHVFTLSGTRDDSVASSFSKLQDGKFWTTFSYLIKSDIEASIWQDRYLNLVHPAGFMMFAMYRLLIIMINETDNEPINLAKYAKDNPLTWIEKLKPKNWRFQHSPRYQPGWMIDNIIKIYAEYIRELDDNVLGAIENFCGAIVDIVVVYVAAHYHTVHEQFITHDKELVDFKFSDGFSEVKISDFDAKYSNRKNTDFLTIGSFIERPGAYSPDSGYQFVVTDNDAQIYTTFNEPLEVNSADVSV